MFDEDPVEDKRPAVNQKFDRFGMDANEVSLLKTIVQYILI